MTSLRRGAHSVLALLLTCAFAFLTIGNASAQASTAITGTVVANGKPVPNATVTLTGNNVTLRTQTSAAGTFAFNALTVGTYRVSTTSGASSAAMVVNLTSAGAEISLDTTPAPQEIGHVVVARNPVVNQSGTDVVIGNEQITRAPVANSLPNILLQAPAAARGSNGEVHLNGDHNGIDYVIDGIEIPEGLNRVLGNEIDPANIGFAELIEGAYPAQYGDKFAGVFNISTKSDTGPAGATFEQRIGSYNLYDSVLGLHTPVGNGGSVYVGVREEHDSWALDPPVPNPVHDAGSISSQFVRYSQPIGQDIINVDLTHSLQTFQIPPDTIAGMPASTDDDEIQEDAFASLIYRHSFGANGALSIGPSYKRSRILDTNDPSNDLFGQVNGANAAPCSTFLDCSFFSVFADRTDINVRFNADVSYRAGRHELRAGGVYGAETLQKDYVMTVPASPDGVTLMPFTVTDTAPNVGHTEEFYVQDGWQIDPHWRADYGVRADAFHVFSTDFDNGFSQVSPRGKLTYLFSPQTTLYVYYGRLFVPFSLESVSPTAAAMLNAGPGVPIVVGTNDLKPQRDSLYEVGGHLPLGKGSFGVRVSHKVSTDWLDDTQVGATNLHQDINFPRGLVDSQSLSYTQPLARSGRVYLSVSHVVALNSANCETQLLQNCAAFGPPGGDLVQADHDQHYDANGGVVINDSHHGWFSADYEYGSGLSLSNTTLCPPFPQGDAVNCKSPPHLTFDVAKGFEVAGPNVQLAFAIQNLFNDRYAITLDNSLQGTHYARPRSFELRLFLGGTGGSNE